jgi:predicted enzyme related to lactoylglutathione lyase
MKKTFLIIGLLASFGLGFAFNKIISKPAPDFSFRRVTGIGGIFFKSKDPKTLKEWYQQHLGMKMDQYGINFEWREGTDSTLRGFTQWSPFKETTKYFSPSTKEFMINYRVANMDLLLEAFKKEGIIPTDSLDVETYGKFIHIMDPEGNKIELWEPNDDAYNKIVKEKHK